MNKAWVELVVAILCGGCLSRTGAPEVPHTSAQGSAERPSHAPPTEVAIASAGGKAAPAVPAPAEPLPTPEHERRPAKLSAESPLGPLTSVPKLLELAEAYLAEQQRGAPDEELFIDQVRYFEAIDAAVIEFRLGEQGGFARRFFGLIGSYPGGHQTLELDPPHCGQLEPDLVDLRGDGTQAVMFTEVGGGFRCHLSGYGVAYEFVAGGWQEVEHPPDTPPLDRDVNADGRPDFSVVVHTFAFGDCNYVDCGDYFFRVDVDGYASWDGKSFSSPGRYQAYYGERFEQFARDARATPKGNNEPCARDRIAHAALVFSYAILAKKPRALAIALSERFLNGIAPKQTCSGGDLMDPDEVRRELLKAVPELVKYR